MFYNQSQKESEAPRIKVLTRKEKKKRDTTENHSNFEQLGRDICATKINFIAHGFITSSILVQPLFCNKLDSNTQEKDKTN